MRERKNKSARKKERVRESVCVLERMCVRYFVRGQREKRKKEGERKRE